MINKLTRILPLAGALATASGCVTSTVDQMVFNEPIEGIGSARQLGSYTLLMKIGEGGMGEVYLARHALLKRPTAIKMLKREFATEEFTMRFERTTSSRSTFRRTRRDGEFL